MNATALTDAKIVAVLITDMVSSTQQLTDMGDELWNQERAHHFQMLRGELERHDGIEVKNTGDGILALFPSAVDAVRAAIAMQQAVERDRRERQGSGPEAAGVEMKVGLHVGEPVHDEADVFGEAVVVATRLCGAAAPGQILTSPLLRALVASRHDLRFEPFGLLALKGLPEPVDAFEVCWSPLAPTSYLDPLAVVRSPSRFVDREPERRTIAGWYDSASAGRRTLGLVSGEPGIGKTRLVVEAARRAHDAGATVLWGRSFEESLAPHGAFVEALRRLIAWADSTGDLPGVTAAARHLVAISPAFGPGNLGGGDGQNSPRGQSGAKGQSSPGGQSGSSGQSGQGDSDRHGEGVLPESTPSINRAGQDRGGDRLRLFDAVDALLRELAAVAPVVLVLDDLQWADDATLLLLSHLVRSPEPDRLLILGTYRDGDAERSPSLRATLADLRREHRVERVRLAGLDEGAAAELVHELSGTSLPEDVVRRVQEQTEGNPFFIEEVMAHLKETRLFDSGAKPPTAADLDAVDLPEGVAELVGRRLSRLDDDTGAVLSVAAVVGREFELQVVEAVARLDRDVVVDALDEAIRAGLVTEDPVTVGRFQFTHTLVRRSLVQRISATRQAHLHQRISEVMDSSLPSDDVPAETVTEADRRRLIELAHHALAAVPLGDPWRAALHARRAGDRALAELAYEQAAGLFDRATRTLEGLVPTDRDAQDLRARLWLGSGEARVLAGDFNGARDAFHHAIDDANVLDDGELRALATLGFGRALGSGVGFEFGVPSTELVELLEDALEGLPPGDSEVRAMLTGRLGAALGSSTDPSMAVPLARGALEMAERIGSPATIAFCLIALRAAGWGRIDREEQRGLGSRIVEAARAAGEPLLELHGRVWQIADAFEDADADMAEAATAEIAALVERIRLPQFSWYLELYDSTRALLDGDVAAAEALSLQALERGSSMGDLNVDLAFGGQTYLQWAERGWLTQLVPIAEEQVERFPTVTAWRAGLAQALAVSGHHDAARAVMAESMEQLRTNPPDPLRPAALAILIDVASRLGDEDAADELHELLSPYDGRIVMIAQMAGSMGAVAHHLGVAAATAGRREAAIEHLRRAVDDHHRLRAPGWEARSLMALAEVAENEREATALLERARSLVDGLDLPDVHRELERLTAELSLRVVRAAEAASAWTTN